MTETGSILPQPAGHNDGNPADQPDALKSMLLSRRTEIVQALGTIDAEISEVQKELSRRLDEARAKRQPLEDALGHLDAILRIEGWVATGQGNTHQPLLATGNGQAPTDAAIDLLTALGKPIHYRELAQRLSTSGTYLAGKDPAATLLSQMSRDERFRRASERGVYGLASWRMRRSPSKKRLAKRKRSTNPR